MTFRMEELGMALCGALMATGAGFGAAGAGARAGAAAGCGAGATKSLLSVY